MLTIVAFVVALGILIAVHEYGHYRVAVACGVKVLRFSVGFGKTILRWQPRGSSTEFVVGEFEEGDDARMVQPCCCLGFTLDPGAGLRAGLDYLDRDVPFEAAVPGSVHGSETTGSQPVVELESL